MNIKALVSSVFCLLIISIPAWSQSEANIEKADEASTEIAGETASEKANDDSPEAVSEPIPIELPDNPEAVVFTYDVKGGPRNPKHEDFEPDPLFRLYASGKVIIGRDRPEATVLEYTMSKEEMLELLDVVINKHHLFDITTDGLKKQIADTERTFFLMDAPVDHFAVELANKQHEVETDGLISTRNFYKEIEQLQTLGKLHDKFVYLRGRAALGTPEEMDRLERSMAKKFKKEFPDGEPMTIKDVTSAFIDKDGNLEAQFDRVDYDGDNPLFAYNCKVTRKDGKTKINFLRARLR